MTIEQLMATILVSLILTRLAWMLVHPRHAVSGGLSGTVTGGGS